MKLLTFFFASTLIISCSNNTITKTSENVKTETKQPALKEELPPLKTCRSDIGRVKSNLNYSIGSKTEFTELLKLLKKKDCEVIEITWVSLSPPERNYDPMSMKVVYNRKTGTLRSIFVKTNVIEEYSEIDEKCLLSFLRSGEKYFASLSDFCKNSKYDFNNREMKQTAIGAKPEQSELDASVKIVKDYVKDNAKDASSIDFLEWSKVSSLGDNWVVRCKYKGTNSFGAVVTENIWFYIQNNKVVDTKTIQ